MGKVRGNHDHQTINPREVPGPFLFPDAIYAHYVRIGMGNPWTIYFSPGPDDRDVWQIDWSASAFFLVRLRTCDCGVRGHLPRSLLDALR